MWLLILFRCLRLDFLEQSVCGEASLATDFYSYGYTSYHNLSEVSKLTKQIEPFIDYSLLCTQFAIYYFCNYVFIPCDLTTGGPISICSNSCYFLPTNCSVLYFQVVSLATTAGYPVNESCENTLIHLQLAFDFPCSSSSLQNDCIDLLSM